MAVLYECSRCRRTCNEQGAQFRPGYSFVSLWPEDVVDGEGYELRQGELCVDCLNEIYKFFHTVFRLRKKDIPSGLKVLVKPNKSVRIEPCRCFDCQLFSVNNQTL